MFTSLEELQLESPELLKSVLGWLDASRNFANFEIAKSFLGEPGGYLKANRDAEKAALRVIAVITSELATLQRQMATELEEWRSK